ncbi:MAG: hypothetical protein A2142_07575 [candidate division Zixibacteria bacterium RBG_16_48_11]|nr:MAG: hypothetical protein A2142_07575 [candidate division Zixibacteria bacterium RBG_16_48_11]
MRKLLASFFLALLFAPIFAQIPAPANEVKAYDTPDDAGNSITVEWQVSPDDKDGIVTGYEILRSESLEGEYAKVGDAPRGTNSYIDSGPKNQQDYFYKIRALSAAGPSNSQPSPVVRTKAQWFKRNRLNGLIALLLLSGGILYFIRKARSGKEIYIRKIAGIEAVEEAVGRATEMGRKIVFIPGIQDMDNMQTIAGITILGHVAKKAAEYEAKLEVPVSRALVMVACREVTKQAFTAAGRPDAYKDDMVYYLTDDQFGYTAALDGLFVREKPAAIFMQGAFFAESLILAETGNYIGAIQIAGTAQPSQLPFFVAACDYTLIGEELFAASAYLSKDVKLLGSLKGQDVGKFLMMAAIFAGVILVSFGIFDLGRIFTVR